MPLFRRRRGSSHPKSFRAVYLAKRVSAALMPLDSADGTRSLAVKADPDCDPETPVSHSDTAGGQAQIDSNIDYSVSLEEGTSRG